MMRVLPQTEFMRLTRGVYALAVKKGNWGWVEQAQLNATLFFSNQWILDNLPHKDPRRNKVNVMKTKVTQEYKPVEMCKDVKLLDDNNNLQCIREVAGGDKDLDLSPSDEDRLNASPLEGESLVWSEQVDLGLGEPQAEDCLMDQSESPPVPCPSVLLPLSQNSVVTGGKLNEEGKEQSRTKSKQSKCPVKGCAKHVRTGRFHVIKQHMPELLRKALGQSNVGMEIKRK